MTSLARTEEPHILSDQAMGWIAEKSADSVFSVRVWLRSEVEQNRSDSTEVYEKLIEKVGTEHKRKGAERTEAKKSIEVKRNGGFSAVTGFSIGKGEDSLTILTVSHVIQEVYDDERHFTAGSADSSTVDILQDIDVAFYCEVMCVHQERLLKGSEVEVRYCGEAKIVAIDTRVDLLALECPIDQINISGDEDMSEHCPHHDSFLAIADLPPLKSEFVLLQGLPNLLSNFQRWGKISVNERPYNVVDDTNEYGYQMKLIEIPGMKCVSGCSGGPLVVGAMAQDRLCYAGVYFKTIKKSGYAVSLDDIKEFLTRFGLHV